MLFVAVGRWPLPPLLVKLCTTYLSGKLAGLLTTTSAPSVAQMGRQSNLIMGYKGMINCSVSGSSHSQAFSESLSRMFV
jgi:hypothetical protein